MPTKGSGSRNTSVATTPVLKAGGKPSTWFPPGGSQNLQSFFSSACVKLNTLKAKGRQTSKRVRNQKANQKTKQKRRRKKKNKKKNKKENKNKKKKAKGKETRKLKIKTKKMDG